MSILKIKKGSSDSIEFAMGKLKEQGKENGEQFAELLKVANNKKILQRLYL